MPHLHSGHRKVYFTVYYCIWFLCLANCCGLPSNTKIISLQVLDLMFWLTAIMMMMHNSVNQNAVKCIHKIRKIISYLLIYGIWTLWIWKTTKTIEKNIIVKYGHCAVYRIQYVMVLYAHKHMFNIGFNLLFIFHICFWIIVIWASTQDHIANDLLWFLSLGKRTKKYIQFLHVIPFHNLFVEPFMGYTYNEHLW